MWTKPGIEYAIVGTTEGTSILSLEDPSNPIEVFWEPGSTSVWRELKTWGDLCLSLRQRLKMVY
jgi:hypothetical protein